MDHKGTTTLKVCGYLLMNQTAAPLPPIARPWCVPALQQEDQRNFAFHLEDLTSTPAKRPLQMSAMIKTSDS